MSFTLIKNIFLLLIGGLITFIFNYLISKLQRREPKIEWKKLPDISITSQSLTGLSWLIESTGKSSSKNVKIRFTLPENSTFQSFEIETSEPALEYNIIEQQDSQKRIIEIPTFPQGITICISTLISKLLERKVQLSIVGEEVIGKEKHGISPEEIDKIHKNFRWLNVGFYSFIVVICIIFITSLVLFFNDFMQLKQIQHISDIHERQKKYDDAIEIYKVYQENSILHKISPIVDVDYNIARIYAIKKDFKRSLLHLKEAIDRDEAFIKVIESEKIFDSIILTPEYQKFIKKIKKK